MGSKQSYWVRGGSAPLPLPNGVWGCAASKQRRNPRIQSPLSRRERGSGGEGPLYFSKLALDRPLFLALGLLLGAVAAGRRWRARASAGLLLVHRRAGCLPRLLQVVGLALDAVGILAL